MKCKICGNKAVIKLRAHNIALCEKDYIAFFEKRVLKTIRKYRMFDKDHKILVAVSGGKDSLSIWELLLSRGFNAVGLYIDLGIENYSEDSKFKCINFAKDKNAELEIANVKEYFNGLSIPEIARYVRRKTCSVCGLIKRYIMNRRALEGGYDVLVTGHNLDDEVSTLFGNMIHWQVEYLARQFPVLEKNHDKMVKKVKPFVTSTEREVAAYALMKGIDYIEKECPFSIGATSLFYKRLLNELEEKQPGSKLRFLNGFYENSGIFQTFRKELKLRACERCGYPTTETVCSFCRLRERIGNIVEKSEDRL
ncbi:MAG: TIGR00269 family protein [Thermotogae bacterium]|nr:TIGR00269 family protein [Thermotogota bacterium]